MYYDGQMDDARLNVALATTAAAAGATVLNYVAVTALLRVRPLTFDPCITGRIIMAAKARRRDRGGEGAHTGCRRSSCRRYMSRRGNGSTSRRACTLRCQRDRAVFRWRAEARAHRGFPSHAFERATTPSPQFRASVEHRSRRPRRSTGWLTSPSRRSSAQAAACTSPCPPTAGACSRRQRHAPHGRGRLQASCAPVVCVSGDQLPASARPLATAARRARG